MSFTTTPDTKQLKLKGKIKGIGNIYPPGQWTKPPGGFPVAAADGRFTIQRILNSKKQSIDIL